MVYNFFKIDIELTLTAENLNLLIDHCNETGLSLDELIFQFVAAGIVDLKMSSL